MEKSNVFGPMSDLPGMQNYQHEYPFTHGRFPFAKIDHVPTGMFYAESVIKTLIPLQKEYNRTRSVMLENRNLAGKPQWGYITGSIDPKKFNSRPGLLLAIQLGFDFPKALDQPQLPPSVVQELELSTRIWTMRPVSMRLAKVEHLLELKLRRLLRIFKRKMIPLCTTPLSSLEAAVQETGIQVLS